MIGKSFNLVPLINRWEKGEREKNDWEIIQLGPLINKWEKGERVEKRTKKDRMTI